MVSRAGKYHTTAAADWYTLARLRLVAELGGKCVYCGDQDTLEFHHTNGGRTWTARKKSRWQRLALYRREVAASKVVLACRGCNARNQ